jgi:hypothetical protein
MGPLMKKAASTKPAAAGQAPQTESAQHRLAARQVPPPRGLGVPTCFGCSGPSCAPGKRMSGAARKTSGLDGTRVASDEGFLDSQHDQPLSLAHTSWLAVACLVAPLQHSWGRATACGAGKDATETLNPKQDAGWPLWGCARGHSDPIWQPRTGSKSQQWPCFGCQRFVER